MNLYLDQSDWFVIHEKGKKTIFEKFQENGNRAWVGQAEAGLAGGCHVKRVAAQHLPTKKKKKLIVQM